MKKRNIILLIIMIIIIIICSIFGYKYFKEKTIKNKLKKDQFEEITKKIYFKNVHIDNKEIGYTYNLNENKFSKTIENNNYNIKEITSINEENNSISIIYSYYDDTCTINQSGVYKNNNFKCSITNRTNKCKTKCDNMLQYINEFKKEIKEYK